MKIYCSICNSVELTEINSYKHYCYVCNDCNNVFHIKKEGRYLLEWILPRRLFKKLLPTKAFLRLFRDQGDFGYENFYDVYVEECKNISQLRAAEVSQLHDQLDYAGIKLEGKKVLDISGGPGLVAKQLTGLCDKIVVTEFSELAVDAMIKVLDINAVKFDYTSDRLQDVFSEKFDLILIRSSIIFCPNLDHFISSLRLLLNTDGCVLVETIMPTVGEILWWQTLEYKFPIIYSQETIEKYFYKHGFSMLAGYRDYGSNSSIKWRQTVGLSRHLFIWLIEYPMVIFYKLLTLNKRIPIDLRLNHKMLTQVWKKTDLLENIQHQPYRNYDADAVKQSTHFAYKYIDYLKK
jgi:2-polyprenyl-3-methyl-5-hydroxy-6-metoxy-1,4-benzoquinol methylase